MAPSFIPGSKSRFNKLYTYTIYKNFDVCNCIQQEVDRRKSGWNDPLQTENMRISQIASNNLGGKITWGNFGTPIKLNYLGRAEGQPGGSLQPLRNRF